MLLQSFADDSIGHIGDERLFMAGYIGDSKTWKLFSNDWQSALNDYPKIDYLRMVEAQGLRNQFRHWSVSDRNKKLLRFCDVIQSHNIFSFEFSVSSKAYRELVKPFAPRGLGDPHFAANFHTVSGLARYFENQTNVKIEFIFDTQKGVDLDVQLFFEYMCRNLTQNTRDKILGVPSFRDDKESIVLQSADMAAWSLRRNHQLGVDSLPIPLASIISEYHIQSEIPSKSLQKWGDLFSNSPNLLELQSKPQWQKFRREMKMLIENDVVAPDGVQFQNLVNNFRERFFSFTDNQ